MLAIFVRGVMIGAAVSFDFFGSIEREEVDVGVDLDATVIALRWRRMGGSE